MKKENKVEISFESGPKVEVIGNIPKTYIVEFINGFNGEVEYKDTIKNNYWTKCHKEYYIPWIIKINGEVKHKLNLENKKVKITFDSKSIGDTIAWMPHVVEFQKIYNCDVTVSTFHNEWFEYLEKYEHIDFIPPNVPFEAYAHYTIGWFKTDGKWDNGLKNPVQPNAIPLIKCITDILNVPFRELNLIYVLLPHLFL